MRLIGTLNNEKDASRFSAFLTHQSIANSVESHTDQDWGSSDYGTTKAHIWVTDEDQVDKAYEWLTLFMQNPDDPQFNEHPTVKIEEEPEILVEEQPKIMSIPPKAPPIKPLGPITLYLLITCTLIFFAALFTQRPYETPPPNLPELPLYGPNILKNLMYDYPYPYEILDKIINAYGFDKLSNPTELPPEGKILLEQYKNTPLWTGLYDKFVTLFKTGKAPEFFNAPLFQKIREGEIWRLFTPVLVHLGPLHIIFNMLWLIVLGRQLEERLGWVRYPLFILITGIFSNTCQYLMGGADFVGFSGVLTAMIGFIWIRQKKAPWEGYQVLPMTLGFIALFVLAMAGLQVFAFTREVMGLEPIISGMGNTAHLSGALFGILLAYTNVFARR